jgi:hypothetical protein
MKHFLFTISLTFLATATSLAQIGNTYSINEISGSTYEWGQINPTNGTMTTATSMSTLGIQGKTSCMDPNGIIYFIDDFSGSNPSIKSLNVSTGNLVSQNTDPNNYIGLLEYSSTTGKLYIVQETSTSYEWGEIDANTGVVSNTSTISLPLPDIVSIDLGESCIDDQNGIIYFTDYNGAGDQTIITLNTNNGVSTQQLTSQEIRYVEFNNSNGKIYCLSDNGSSVGWAEIDPATGTVSNFTAFSVAINYIDDLPGTCIDQQNSILYFGEYDFEGATTNSIVGINLNTGVVTKQSISFELGVLEHWNGVVSAINEIDASKNNVNVYPNPFTNQIQIAPVDGLIMEELTLYSIAGQKIFRTKDLTGIISIDKEIEKGVYILEITTNRGQILKQQLVKN